MIYPNAIEIDEKEYEINTGFETALACIKAINDESISKSERAYAVIGLLYKGWPENESEAVRLAVKYLRCGKEDDKHEDIDDVDMDFEYDESYIRASFLSDYHIDLDDSPDMHWWKFYSAMQGLTDSCILNRIRDIRNYDLSTVKDPKSRRKIEKAKRGVALPIKVSEEDNEALDSFYSQLR